MGSINETIKDSEGNKFVIFDETSLYDDKEMGDNLSDFEILQILTEDQNQNQNQKQCIVIKVRSLNNNKLYAMKKINNNINENILQKLIQLNNPHILKYYKYFNDNNNYYLIMELMNNDNIDSFINAHYKVNKIIKEEEIWNILLQCTSALEYLHKYNLNNLGIRLTDIFMNNEQNSKISVFSDPPNQEDFNYDKKDDILLLGRYFYKMVFSNLERVHNCKINNIELVKEINQNYSNDLMNIIYKMVNYNIDERPDSSELFMEVQQKYVQIYARNTSINAILRCLYSYSNLNNIIFNKENDFTNNKEKYYINYWYLKAIKGLAGFDEDNVNLNKCIQEFRMAIASDNSKLDGNKEIDPLYLLGFLLEKMHKETNEINENNQQGNNQGNNKTNFFFNEEEDKSNKEQMLHKFISNYNKNIHSPISELFLGITKRKRKCSVCNIPNYSFSNFCFVFFDLSQRNNNDNFDLLKDGFKFLYDYDNIISAESPDRVYCRRCLSYQKHDEYNRFYKMNNQMIIYFMRGNNFQNKSQIVFEELLNVKDYVDEKTDSPISFNLVGSINRIINDKGNEEYIYYARDPDNKNLWYLGGKSNEMMSDNIQTEIAPTTLMQDTGQIVMLFYDNLKNNFY